MREMVEKVYWILSVQFGFDIRRLSRSLRGVSRYASAWYRFRRDYTGGLELRPCLYDWFEEGGETKSEYFWQDLYVARKICIANPEKHVDVGSRIDGFVAHIASFREIEIFDIRPVTSHIPGIVYKQADLMASKNSLIDYCDSLSCLHALEHFGLGRYGDPVDPYGDKTGLANMSKIIRRGGVFYLSVPVGKERVEFNAHRIFDPLSLVHLAAENGLLLHEFSWVASSQGVVQSELPEQTMAKLAQLRYTLGIFTFIKQ